ncbi:DUF4148 domain-containing protein [Piscinibacter sp. XHJ-5]|uniref:DUF4148 domain-containing protein n=1 Tax=Piscinibacter sp. XHJ-5 TaxID=3037797 RepID=UPI0024532D9E|nr:DUF4148 domain-containing protein [Piscinibacter sp. XHJ-5]
MGHKQLVAAGVFALLGGAAFAMEATEFPIEPSTRTRAEVKAELQAAIANGEIVRGEASLPPQPPVASTRTREEVRAEAYAAARDHHRFNDLYVGA